MPRAFKNKRLIVFEADGINSDMIWEKKVFVNIKTMPILHITEQLQPMHKIAYLTSRGGALIRL